MDTAPEDTPDMAGTGSAQGGPVNPGATGAAGAAGGSGGSGAAGGSDSPATGHTTVPPHAPPGYGDEQRLHRGGRGRMLAGVAVGLADYFDVDPTIVRVGFVALAFLGGLAVPLYLAGWLLIPDEDSDVSVAEELLARERARGAF
jgi:phage shock protein PspC (stress-responsive transcriptional regulator)